MALSRREFLGLVGAGGVVVAAPRCAEAAPADREKVDLCFALVSDMHLGRKGSKSPARWMRQVVDEINASQAEMTIFLGDLVDTGRKNEALYPEWVKIAKRLKRPFYAIPGNHDPGSFFTKYIRPKTDYAIDHKGLRFVFFQDTRTTSHLGTVTPKQLEWIAGQVDDAARKGRRVILCAHITAHPNKHPDTGWWVRTGEKELRALLRAKSDTVVAFFCGHFHCGLRGWSDLAGIHEIVVPSTCWNGDRGLKRAPGFALEEFRRGYVLAELRRDELALRYKPIGAAAAAEKRLAFRPAVAEGARRRSG